jgi:hypothetical protein
VIKPARVQTDPPNFPSTMETSRKRVRFADDVKGSCEDIPCTSSTPLEEPLTPDTSTDTSFDAFRSTPPPSAYKQHRVSIEAAPDSNSGSNGDEEKEIEEGECSDEQEKEDTRDYATEYGECSEDNWTSCDEDDDFI